MPQIVLASASPRRQQLLRILVPDFIVDPADLDEEALTLPNPFETAKQLALAKANHVANRHPNCLVIGSDTVVALESEGHWLQLAKPQDEGDAFRMLTLLRGKTHSVITGVSLVSNSRQLVDCDSTQVTFHQPPDDQIWEYIQTGEPMDKAGAYGAQGMGAFLVKHLEGEFDTVVGLPMKLLRHMMARFGIQ